MKKRIFLIWLFAVLLLLSACSTERHSSGDSWWSHYYLPFDRDDAPADPEDGNAPAFQAPEEAYPEEASPSLPAAIAPGLPYEDQIALIVTFRDAWSNNEDYAVPYSYAVTDLDQNGRLELVASVCIGTGYFSYTTVWEVSESYDSLNLCHPNYDTTASEPDLAVSTATVYFDGSAYHYVFVDSIRNGWAYNASVKSGYSLQDGTLSNFAIAIRESNNDMDGTSVITCRDTAGNELTEEEYEAAEASYYMGCAELTAAFCWNHLYHEDLHAMDVDTLYQVLWESWDGFTLS